MKLDVNFLEELWRRKVLNGQLLFQERDFKRLDVNTMNGDFGRREDGKD